MNQIELIGRVGGWVGGCWMIILYGISQDLQKAGIWNCVCVCEEHVVKGQFYIWISHVMCLNPCCGEPQWQSRLTLVK